MQNQAFSLPNEGRGNVATVAVGISCDLLQQRARSRGQPDDKPAIQARVLRVAKRSHSQHSIYHTFRFGERFRSDAGLNGIDWAMMGMG